MEHDDDIGAEIQCCLVTTLLIRTVAPVLVVSNRDEAEVLCLPHRVVGARVIHEQDVVDHGAVELVDRPLQRFASVVKREALR